MATYKEIKGVTIQTLDEDPVTAGATWASGGNMNAGRAGIAGAGIQTANVGFGGITSNPPAAGTANTESYNGTSWTEVNNLNNDREITNGVGLYPAAYVLEMIRLTQQLLKVGTEQIGLTEQIYLHLEHMVQLLELKQQQYILVDTQMEIVLYLEVPFIGMVPLGQKQEI